MRGEGREKRWAVVLGPTSGTGAAVARALARDPGLNIFGVHRGNHAEEAASVAADVEATGRVVRYRIADAGTPEGAESGVRELVELAGRGSVTTLVHSIANGSVGRFVRTDGEPLHAAQIRSTFDGMAHSFIYWVQALVAQGALAPNARLVGLTNPLVDNLIADCGAISAAKAALAVYVRHLAFELGPLGHRVNLVNFGAAETSAMEHVFVGDARERLREVHAQVTPAGRLVQVDEIARFISLLVGHEACAWFNGATIDLTGASTQSLYQHIMHPEG